MANRRGPAYWAVLALLLAGQHTMAAATDVAGHSPGQSCGFRAPGDTRPRIGLALGGGGARGIAHISVLRLIDELDIPVDCVAGTSMGALVGGLYASGMPIQEMENLVVDTDWKRLFDDSLERPDRSFRRKQDDRDNLATLGVGFRGGKLRLAAGVLQGERILAMFENATLGTSGISDFDRLPIPYRAVATDLNTGDAVVIGSGSLAMAMRASMSLPGIFQPVELEGRVLLDGGLVNQVPVDVVRAMGADIVIAVDVGTPLAPLDSSASLLQVVNQITGMMTTGNTRRRLVELTDRDVLIVPELGSHVSTGDFTKAREALAIGTAAAQAARPRLAALALPVGHADAGRQWRPAASGPPVIEFVRLDNQTDYADALLESYLAIPVGEPLDTARTERNLLRAYSLGTISSVTYEVVEEEGRTGVVLRVRPKLHGPNYVQLGLTSSTDFDGHFESNLRAAVLFSPLSPFGAEGRISVAIGSEPALKGEYYHPLDVGNRNLLYGSLGYENPNIEVYNAAGDNVAVYDVRRVGIELRAAREFGNYGVLQLGLRRASGSASVEVGDPALEDFDFEQGDLYVAGIVDRLDSLAFPRHGYYAQAGYTISREWLGADTEFAQADLDLIGARSFGRHSVQMAMRYHSTVSGQAPLQDRYRLGGRGRLAGYRLNQLTGQHYAMLVGGYSYETAKFLGRPALLGGTLEYGNAWEARQDMDLSDGVLNASLYAGFDSWLGPMSFGVGWREGGSGLFFLEIGRPF